MNEEWIPSATAASRKRSANELPTFSGPKLGRMPVAFQVVRKTRSLFGEQSGVPCCEPNRSPGAG